MMMVYKPGDMEAEILLGQAYMQMYATEDLTTLFGPANEPSLARFLALYQPPIGLLFDTDDKGIWFMAWCERTLQAAYLALWIRPDMRHTLSAYKNVLETFALAVSLYPTVLSTTYRDDRMAEYVKLGYTLLCVIPHLYGLDRPGWLMRLDPEQVGKRVRRFAKWSDEDRERIAKFWPGAFEQPPDCA